MPVVVQHHGLRIDVRLERRIVIRQRWQQMLRQTSPIPSHHIAAPGYSLRNHPVHPYFSRISFLTDVTPPTPRATSTALLIFAWEVTKPLN